uniref:Uncharacterized protein n=1 Tax=Arundo donax TaxID=35708 RepID=A0A0A9GJV7_ARUDO
MTEFCVYCVGNRSELKLMLYSYCLDFTPNIYNYRKSWNLAAFIATNSFCSKQSFASKWSCWSGLDWVD